MSVPHARSDRKAVLIADDDVAHSLLFADALMHLDLDVEWRTNGECARILLDERDYDVAIVETTLPDDGMSLLRWLRDHRPTVDAVVVTRLAEPLVAVEAMRLGAVDFIEKPVAAEQIRWAIMRLFQHAGSGRTIASSSCHSSDLVPAAITERQFDAAAAVVFRFLTADHTNARALSNLAELHWLRGDVSEAYRCCQAALSLDPGCTSARATLHMISPPEIGPGDNH